MLWLMAAGTRNSLVVGQNRIKKEPAPKFRLCLGGWVVGWRLGKRFESHWDLVRAYLGWEVINRQDGFVVVIYNLRFQCDRSK